MDSLRCECLRRQRVVKSLRTVSGLGITQREEEGSGVEATPVSYLAVHTSHAQGGGAGSLLGGLIRPKSRRHMAGPSRSRAQLLLRAHSYPGRVLFLVVGLPTPFPRWLPLGACPQVPVVSLQAAPSSKPETHMKFFFCFKKLSDLLSC